MWCRVDPVSAVQKSVKGVSLVKRRKRLRDLTDLYPDRAELYTVQIEEVDVRLAEIHACRKCGRKLEGEESMRKGFGPECEAALAAEAAENDG